MKRRLNFALTLAVSAALAGCSLAPAYKVPETPVADHYKEPAQQQGPWVPAQPSDQLQRDGWWKVYTDSQLNDLQQRLLEHNADLEAALAHFEQSQAFYRQTRADLFPQVGLNGNAQRDRESDTKPLRGATSPAWYNTFTATGEIDYEVDLWGRVRNSVLSSKDQAIAAAADLASVQLSLQAQLTDSYVVLRGLDQQVDLLKQSTDAFTKALQLTQTLHQGGIVSGLDVARAQTQLSTVKSQWSQTLAQRALVEHAIAVLVGETPSKFSIAPETKAIPLPTIPTDVPSTLLQRRPDIAAAERRTAASNAEIGVARAAYFPSLGLSAQSGYQSDVYGSLLSTPNRIWAFGPNILETIFDGGRRKAQVAAAKAATEESGAKYRGVVLNAFQQVEDNLAQLDHLGTARVDQKDAADAAQHSLDLAMDRYKQGAVGYLDVVQAQTAWLDAQASLLDIDTRQLRSSVQLIRALGGGWSTDALADAWKKTPVK
jgi:NodT family efflux transporter outer membrane factor (OMF) lipoprotein